VLARELEVGSFKIFLKLVSLGFPKIKDKRVVFQHPLEAVSQEM
jgi:hypothetical protein